MKTLIKYILQQIFGLKNYLYLFSLFIIRKLPRDRNEKDFMHFLSILPEGGDVLDIGANLGVMSYYLAKGHPLRSVYAFEPIPVNFQNLQKIKSKFNLENLELYQLALGNENGTIEMVMPVKNSVRFHGLAHVKHEDIQGNNEGLFFQCPVHKLDDFEFPGKDPQNITGIKMDVENFEYYVLLGAQNMLKKHMPVIYCELWDNENRIKTIDLLVNMGYKVMLLKEDVLTNYIPEKHSSHNFFFVKE